jgi:hypothetical protein
VQTPASEDAFGRKVFRRRLPFNFLMIVEARPGPNNVPVGQSLPAEDDGLSVPDLLLQANQNLGDGSPAVCDKGPEPDIGGVPGFAVFIDSTDTPAVRRAFIDLACRFQVHARSDEACTVNSLGNFRFASEQITSQTIQFCFEPAVGTEVSLPRGATILRARVRDRNGGIGDPVEIVVDVD